MATDIQPACSQRITLRNQVYSTQASRSSSYQQQTGRSPASKRINITDLRCARSAATRVTLPDSRNHFPPVEYNA